MSGVKSIRAELAKMRKQMEQKEAELRREEVYPLLDSFTDGILDDSEICEKLSEYKKDEMLVLAKHFVLNFDRIARESAAEIKQLRDKKAERAAKRKAAKQSGGNVVTPTQNTSSYNDYSGYEPYKRESELVDDDDSEFIYNGD